MVSEWVESGTTLALIFVELTLPRRTSDALHHYGFLSHVQSFLWKSLRSHAIRILNIVTFTRRSLILLGKLGRVFICRNREEQEGIKELGMHKLTFGF